MEGDWGGNAVQETHSKDTAEKKFHNGREMRNLLPLCKENGRAAGRLKKLCRNTGPLPSRSESTKPSPRGRFGWGKTMPTLSAISLFLGDLLPSVAHPRPPAADFAEDEEKS